MSGAKKRMREKKLSKQPASVQYGPRNCRETPVSGHSGHGSSSHEGEPNYRGGWHRGHQKDGEGYDKELPKFIPAKAFVAARAAEVTAMLKAVTKATGSCHVFGAMPKHMRRRAMSHNTKRLPCRLRDAANRMREKSLKAGPKKKEQAKNKSRKARRRHGNMLLEFNRRQRKNVWLETHIWHAKRFHVLKKWGYCLGDRPTTKCYRACYRAMSSHCLLQDLSYHCCIELQGEEEQLLACLSQLTSKETGPTFATAVSLSGRRQGSVVVYRAGHYPSQPLGPVTFLWKPRTQGSTHRQLWIWTHPTLKQDLLPELQSACQCCEAVFLPVTPAVAPAGVVPTPEPLPAKPPQAEQVIGTKRKRSCRDADGPPVKKILGDGTRAPNTPTTWTSRSTGIVINDLTMELVRYRLIGPQSHSVLTETLEPATDCDPPNKSQTSSLWWPEHCRDGSKMALHRQQADTFQILKGIYSTGEIPPGTVLGLNVDDPRVNLPKKRGKALPDVLLAQEVDVEKRRELTLHGVPEHCCQSSLWDAKVRDNVTNNKMSEQEMNRMRREVLVPGSRLSPTPLQGRVPVLLVHQPGKQTGQEMSSWGSGWDLLLPKGWGMAFWVPLVYRGVRIGGLKVSLKHSQNKGAPHFPHDYPDCAAGVRFQKEQEAELLDKFKRRPPAKRTNYIKHGCLAPFRCPWRQLAEEWELITSDRQGQSWAQNAGAQAATEGFQSAFSVLRHRKSLRLLSDWCRPTTSKGQRSRRGRVTLPLDSLSASSLLSAHGRSLVWVRLSLPLKGKPELHALVCAPTLEDLRLRLKEPGCSGPQEPPHKDHFKSKTKRRKMDSSQSEMPKISDPKPPQPSGPTPQPSGPTPQPSGPTPQPSGPTPQPSGPTPQPSGPTPQPSGPTPQPSGPTPQPSGPTPQPSDPTPQPSDATDQPLGPTPHSSDTTSQSSRPTLLTEIPGPSSSPDLTFGLWPRPLPSVTGHCSRVALGWVTQGDFSLSSGCGEALGFVSLAGLLSTLLSQPVEQRGWLLLRNPNSLQYRFAKVNIEV